MTHVNLLPLTRYYERFGIVNFVETGCFLGEALRYVQQYTGIPQHQMFSCDINPQYVQAVSQEFPNANLRCQGSLEFLMELLPKLEGPTLFWLDAHFPELHGSNGFDVPQWPLLEEIDTVLRLKRDVGRDIILCDDIRVIEDPANPAWRTCGQGLPDQYIRRVDWGDFLSKFVDTHCIEVLNIDTGVLQALPKFNGAY
jgi:hypothetical protein